MYILFIFAKCLMCVKTTDYSYFKHSSGDDIIVVVIVAISSAIVILVATL